MKLNTKMFNTVISDAEERMRPFREAYRTRVVKYLGYRYSADNIKDVGSPRFQNLIALQVNTIKRYLSSQNPRCNMTTRDPKLGPEAYTLELLMNRTFEQLELGELLSECIADALLGGVATVKIARSGNVSDEQDVEATTYVQRVSLDDLVLDLAARDAGETTFIGNWYRLPIEFIESAYNVKPGSVPVSRDTHTGVRGQRRTSSIASGARNGDRIVDFGNLLDLYLPLHGQIATLTENYNVIRMEPWGGPASGPYVSLKFLDGPDQMFPVALVATVEDLEGAINEMYRKLSEQAMNQKDVYAAPLASHKDSETVLNAADGTIVNVVNTSQIMPLKFRGPDQGVTAIATMWRQQCLELMGGLQQLAAMGPQADTATQEKLLATTASSLVSGLQDHAVEFTARIMKQLTWYRWHDGKSVDTIQKVIANRSVTETFGPARNGYFSDYDVLLEPFSMQRKSPQERLNILTGIVQQLLIPMAPAMAQQGIQFNFAAYLDYVTKYSGGSELASMLQYTSPMRMAEQHDAAMMKAPTHSVYERVNRPGTNPQQRDEMLAKMVGGDQEQPAEMAGAVRGA